jgi:hypothetical protein
VIALSVALSLGFGLAYAAWRDWLRFKQPVAPHEELVARVAALEAELNSIRAWAKR